MFNATDRKYGYNVLIGGNKSRLGVKCSEKQKEQIRQKLKGRKLSKEQCEQMSRVRKGIVPVWCKAYNHTKEAEEKRYKTMHERYDLHARQKGSKSPQAKAVKMFDLNHNYIKTFGACTEAQEEAGIDYGSIVKVCRKQRFTAGGYYWEYAN